MRGRTSRPFHLECIDSSGMKGACDKLERISEVRAIELHRREARQTSAGIHGVNRLLPRDDLAVPKLATEDADLQGLLTRSTGLEPATPGVTGRVGGHDRRRRAQRTPSFAGDFLQ